MKDIEALELKNMILSFRQELDNKISLLMPDEFSLSFLAQRTGWSRAGLNGKLKRTYVEDVDFYLKNNRIFMTKKTALEMIVSCPLKKQEGADKCAS